MICDWMFLPFYSQTYLDSDVFLVQCFPLKMFDYKSVVPNVLHLLQRLAY